MNTRPDPERFSSFNQHIDERSRVHRDELDRLRYAVKRDLLKDAKNTLLAALGLDAEQYRDISGYKGDPVDYPFDHYLNFFLPSQETAQEGLEFKKTVGFRLVDDIDENSRPVGDEMQIRFILPEDLDLDDTTDELTILDWVTNIKELYIVHRKATETLYYRVSEEGMQEYEPIGESIGELEIEFEYFMDTQTGDRLGYMETIVAADFYKRLGTMKFYPFDDSAAAA